MRNDFESNYLMHHGILGQKWGKRNGPPYPLDFSQKSKAEKTEAHKKKAEKYAKNAASVATAAVILGGIKLASTKGLIKIGSTYVNMYLAASKPALTVGVVSNLAASGAHYAAYKLGEKKQKEEL